MKQIALFLPSLFLVQPVKAQAPEEPEYYLNLKTVSKNAKNYYYGKFHASDDDRTFSILDILKQF